MSLRFMIHALKRLIQDPQKNLRYFLGRFYAVRIGYGKLVGFAQRHNWLSGLSPASHQVVKIDQATNEIVKSLEEKSVFLPVTVPAEDCYQIVEDVKQSKLRHFGYREEFYYAEIKEHRLPSGKPAILAEVIDADKHPLIQDIAHDEQILVALERYLKYRPRKVDPHILWSFAGPWGEKERLEAGQSICFHYDSQNYHFAHVYYYLTKVDHTTGAHVMVCGSHGKKPLSWLLRTASQAEEVLITKYGADQIITIEGPPGYGFIQDASCYHKALAPISSDRLMLLIRYS